MKRIPWITIAMGVVALGIHALGERASEALQWHSELFASGQLWRLVGGHLCHWDWNHLVWDLTAFVALGWILERRLRESFLAALLLTAVATEPLLRWTDAFETYRGLSGFCVALFALALLKLLEAGRRKRDGLAVVGAAGGLVALVAKIAFEASAGLPLFAGGDGGFEVAVEAHLAGLLAGAISWLALRPRRGRRPVAEETSLDNIPTGRF